MNFDLGPDAEAFRAEVAEFLEEIGAEEVADRAHRTGTIHDWDVHRAMAAKGWLTASWPKEYGGQERDVFEMTAMGEEFYRTGAPIEVTFYDAEYDEEDEEMREEDSRDDFMIVFVGPTPAAIMQVQRDLLVQDVIALMERHFDASELTGVVGEVDKLFTQRFDALVESLEIGKPPRGSGNGGHRGRNKPRHLH